MKMLSNKSLLVLRIKILISALLALASFTNVAHSTPITISYTGDDSVNFLVVVNDNVHDYALGEYSQNWRIADTLHFQLETGSHELILGVSNSDCNCRLNPAGFLLQIEGPGISGDLLTGSSWEYALAPPERPTSVPEFARLSWLPVTSYGRNGSGNVWTTYGGLISDISPSAEWIWSGMGASDFAEFPHHEHLYFRGNILVHSVPEPDTFILMLIGLGALRFRKTLQQSA